MTPLVKADVSSTTGIGHLAPQQICNVSKTLAGQWFRHVDRAPARRLRSRM